MARAGAVPVIPEVQRAVIQQPTLQVLLVALHPQGAQEVRGPSIFRQLLHSSSPLEFLPQLHGQVQLCNQLSGLW